MFPANRKERDPCARRGITEAHLVATSCHHTEEGGAHPGRCEDECGKEKEKLPRSKKGMGGETGRASRKDKARIRSRMTLTKEGGREMWLASRKEFWHRPQRYALRMTRDAGVQNAPVKGADLGFGKRDTPPALVLVLAQKGERLAAPANITE
ncbi:hypothetical protein B0H17DRAFT_1153520 [Mycena rosella]|uniref:Uncharacterized protein n=1 Tax=Mycena rosella TaxID=1033263 RepID=A0AAD7B6I1_MYCRO|nr:hypothetical protein B0H17DRAFT_1153520 [Mycena rosella]